MKKKYPSKDELYKLYITNNNTIQQISKIYGCCRSKISSLLSEYDIQYKYKTHKNKLTYDFLYNEYIVKKKSKELIAKEINSSTSTITKRLQALNIPTIDYTNDIINTKIGSVLIKSYHGKKDTKLKNTAIKFDHYFNCICDCGNELVLSRRQLRPERKNCPQCRCNLSARKGYMDINGKYWNRCIREAKKRNLDFTISIEYGWDLIIKQNYKCSLSGVDIKLDIKCTQKSNHEQTASLDRIDSSLGYIDGNVQWVHKEINWIKCDMHDDIFIDWCNKVSEFTKKRT
jgi:hypothetical protein